MNKINHEGLLAIGFLILGTGAAYIGWQIHPILGIAILLVVLAVR